MVWSTLINCQQQEDESTINERNNSIILTDYNQLMVSVNLFSLSLQTELIN